MSEFTERISRSVFNRSLFIGLCTGVGGDRAASLAASVVFQPTEEKPEEKPRNLQSELTHILSLPLTSDGRTTAEVRYFVDSDDLESIDGGFQVLSRREIRALLFRKRHDLRLAGHPDLTPLAEAQTQWAISSDIHPEVLGICLDAYPKAKEVIAKLKPKLRPDLPNIDPDLLMINPGGMAELVRFETGFRFNPERLSHGFCDIGSGLAVEEVNLDQKKGFPTAIDDLTTLCQNLSADTNLPFDPQNLPGSLWGDRSKNVSGGAIGLQFMPPNALRIYRMLDEAGVKFNPFDLSTSLIGGWVFLAEQEFYQDGRVFRYGYLRGNRYAIESALQKWNPHDDQIYAIYNAASSYYDTFIA